MWNISKFFFQIDTMESLLETEMKATINGVLKNFFSRELAMKCCAVKLPKAGSSKIILKGTSFYNSILGTANFICIYAYTHNTTSQYIFFQRLFEHTSLGLRIQLCRKNCFTRVCRLAYATQRIGMVTETCEDHFRLSY